MVSVYQSTEPSPLVNYYSEFNHNKAKSILCQETPYLRDFLIYLIHVDLDLARLKTCPIQSLINFNLLGILMPRDSLSLVLRLLPSRPYLTIRISTYQPSLGLSLTQPHLQDFHLPRVHFFRISIFFQNSLLQDFYSCQTFGHL